MGPRKDIAATATYGDHEVITPENKLRNAVSWQPPVRGEKDPILRTERAPSALSPQFESWMDSECYRLDQARRNIGKNGLTTTNKRALFHVAHDIKGEAATFGCPAVAAAADSLCRLIEHTPDVSCIPISLLDQHVDAARAIYREYAHSDAKELGGPLTKRLREVTDEFLIHEIRDRLDMPERIAGPSIAPEQTKPAAVIPRECRASRIHRSLTIFRDRGYWIIRIRGMQTARVTPPAAYPRPLMR